MLMISFCAFLLAIFGLAAANSSTIRKNNGNGGHPDLQFLRAYELVIPERIVSDGYTEIFSTKSRERTLKHNRHRHRHDSNPTFSIAYKNSRTFVLDLQLHRTLISGDYMEIYASDNSTQKQKQIRPEACHYHGSIRGSPDSMVVMSTCHGLRGHFSERGNVFHIQPHPDFDAAEKMDYPIHVVYEDRDIKKNGSRRCGHNATNRSYPDSILEDFADFEIKVNNRLKRQIERRSTILYLNFENERRYIELFLVFDYNYWLVHPDRDAIRARAISMINTVDSIFKYANTRVVLTGIQIWDTGNPVNITKWPISDLSRFCEWRKENLIGTVPHDIAHLIIGIDLDGNPAGIARVGSACTDLACGVIQDVGTPTATEVAYVITHELGHNLGMHHDDNRQYTRCWWEGGCVMSKDQGTDPRSWTQTNMNDMNQYPMPCLFNYPTTFYADAYCGNGIVEAGEECDCGAPEKCPDADPGCETTGCKLKSGLKCSWGKCCYAKTGQFKENGTVCREKSGDCDIADVCTGDSNVCPDNRYQPDGTDCNSNKSYCLTGDCVNGDEQCQLWFGVHASMGTKDCFTLDNSNTFFYEHTRMLGYCGNPRFGGQKTCRSEEDYICGRLTCQHPNYDPVLPNLGTNRFSTIFQNGTGNDTVIRCMRSQTTFGKDVIKEHNIVRKGTKCAEGKMCSNGLCQTFEFLGIGGPATEPPTSTTTTTTTTASVGSTPETRLAESTTKEDNSTSGNTTDFPTTTTAAYFETNFSTPTQNITIISVASGPVADLMTVGVLAIASRKLIW